MSHSQHPNMNCGETAHQTSMGATMNRRSLLAAMGLSAGAWLTPLGEHLAWADEQTSPRHRGKPAKSLIVLWMAGGPSQLETFDPHPDTEIAAGSKARKTNRPGILLGDGMEQLAEKMDKVSLVRSIVSKEGDHERATYYLKNGFRPNPTIFHPSIGAVCCHQLEDNIEIPRHVSILPDQWPARGGYLGAKFDAFKIGDPRGAIPDVRAPVTKQRFDRRLSDLDVLEQQFGRGRPKNLDSAKLQHRQSMQAALRMMSSEQLSAFDVSQESQSVLAPFGDTPFGRGCMAAVRLVEAGVRCVEVTLSGWDSHINNHELQGNAIAKLDPAFAALIAELERRDLLDSTVVMCGGEFGRTPRINPTGGRDHWPHGFSMALAGGGIAGGQVIGETAPNPEMEAKNKAQFVKGAVSVADVHATVLRALGIDFQQMLDTPVGRPMIISEGEPLPLLKS